MGGTFDQMQRCMLALEDLGWTTKSNTFNCVNDNDSFAVQPLMKIDASLPEATHHFWGEN